MSDYLLERGRAGMPKRLVWIPPEHRQPPPPKPPVGTFRVRLRGCPQSGRRALTEPIPVDASRETVEAAVAALGVGS